MPSLYAAGEHGSEFDLKRNRYFTRLAERGYRLRAYQSDHMDFCAGLAGAAECESYIANGIGALQEAPLTTAEKARVIAGVYLSRSNAYILMKDAYAGVRSSLHRVGLPAPAWTWDRDRVGPLTSIPIVEKLAHDLKSGRRGDFFFAHLLMPHHPYIFDARCGLVPVEEWMSRMAVEAPGGRSNTPATRAVGYAKYTAQVQCVYTKVEQLLQAIPRELQPDAIVIIQGDHGSRLTLRVPRRSNADLMSVEDYADSFSTLFAVRSPQLSVLYDATVVSITCLLKTLTEDDYRSVGGLELCAANPAVFLRGRDEQFISHPLPSYVR